MDNLRVSPPLSHHLQRLPIPFFVVWGVVETEGSNGEEGGAERTNLVVTGFSTQLNYAAIWKGCTSINGTSDIIYITIHVLSLGGSFSFTQT